MRIESMVAQQAVLAASTTRRARAAAAASSTARADAASARPRTASSGLPGAVADRLAQLLAADPGLAEAVSAQLPAARRASARDLAAYSTRGPDPRPRFIDTAG
jgi:hypothetical protein